MAKFILVTSPLNNGKSIINIKTIDSIFPWKDSGCRIYHMDKEIMDVKETIEELWEQLNDN